MPALEGGGALLDAGRFHQSARRRGQVADRKLVDAVRDRRGGHVHVEAQIIGGERANKLTRFFEVEKRMLASRRAEHDVSRALAHRIEKAVGSKIANAGLADGGDPADRSRYDEGLEGVVLQSMLVVARRVKHCA